LIETWREGWCWLSRCITGDAIAIIVSVAHAVAAVAVVAVVVVVVSLAFLKSCVTVLGLVWDDDQDNRDYDSGRDDEQ
jgi:hypothetical protein